MNEPADGTQDTVRPAPGCLYGVGVGPGDPELLTLRARRVLQQVPVICVPQAAGGRDSIALTIVGEYLDPAQEILRAPFPTDDARGAAEVWLETARTLVQRLEQGQDVAFLTEGDPTVYSTFSYVAAAVAEIDPGVPIRIVPGVSSVTAAAARAQLPLGTRRERVAVLPAAYGVDDLTEVAENFDSVVLMKVNRSLVRQLASSPEEGLKGKATYVRRATTVKERVVRDLNELTDEDLDYFSILILRTDRQEPAARLEDT